MVIGPDKALSQILKQRLLRSDGEDDAHCFTREPANLGTSHASGSQGACMEELVGAPGKLFSMNSGDTPPASRCSSPHCGTDRRERLPQGFISNGHGDLKSPLKGGAEDEAESTDGLPDQHEGGDDGDLQSDLHYDWQFDLMNSMPREKALELARKLKRSEQEKFRESEKLRQEVSGLKKEMKERSNSTFSKCWWMSCAMAIVSALLGAQFAGVAFPVVSWRSATQASLPPDPPQASEEQSQQSSSSSAREALQTSQPAAAVDTERATHQASQPAAAADPMSDSSSNSARAATQASRPAAAVDSMSDSSSNSARAAPQASQPAAGTPDRKSVV